MECLADDDFTTAARGPGGQYDGAAPGAGEDWTSTYLREDRPQGEPEITRRSECWEALLVQIRAAEDVGSFVFSHRRLDGVTSMELATYLRDVCCARFVDLSYLDRWWLVSMTAATALRHGLRQLRSLTLDGTCIAANREAFEAWCGAFEEHPGMQLLSLRDVGLDDVSTSRLARCLDGHLTLFSVDISCNRLGDAGLEAIFGALTENAVLLELATEDTDASEHARVTLEAMLNRNRENFGGRERATNMLQRLRRARVAAVTALSRGGALTPAVAAAAPRRGDWDRVCDTDARRLSAAVEVGGGYVMKPLVQSIEDRLSSEPDAPDGVVFEAGEALFKELAMRCEATWRYAPDAMDLLRDMQRQASDLLVQRRLAATRTDEACERIERVQRDFRQRASTVEARLAALKEQLACDLESQKPLLEDKIRQNLRLRALQEELEAAQQDRDIGNLNAQQLVLGLKLRHREVDEEAEKLRAEVLLTEEAVEKLERENERNRRRLHAVRFETETERFAPRPPAPVGV